MLAFHSVGAAIALAGVLAIPTLETMPIADRVAPPVGGSAAVMPTTATTGMVVKGPAGTLHRTHGLWRSASLVGATVYTVSGENVGTISNLLISPRGGVSMAVLSVGGFLGVGNKLVEVPFSALRFVRSVNNRTAAGATTPATAAPSQAALAATATPHPAKSWKARTDYSVVLPDSSKAALTRMATFSYRG